MIVFHNLCRDDHEITAEFLIFVFIVFLKKISFLFFFHFSPFFACVSFHFCFLVFFWLSFLFILIYLSFEVFFQGSLHSGRSKVTRGTVGRDTGQPKFSSFQS